MIEEEFKLDETKNINENIDSAIKVIEEHKKLLKKNQILQGKVDYLKNVIEEAMQSLGINESLLKSCEFVEVNGIEVYNILKKSYTPTFEEVEELFREQKS